MSVDLAVSDRRVPGGGSRVAFISTMGGDPWGGSEELWWEAAMELRARGVPVSAAVMRWPERHPRIVQLVEAGVEIFEWSWVVPLHKRALYKLQRRTGWYVPLEIGEWLKRQQPSLVVISDGFSAPSHELLAVCVEARFPFVTVSHANHELWWPSDEGAARLRFGLEHALCAYFVSEGNLRLARKQIGLDAVNTAIVRNPYGVPFDYKAAWPALAPEFGLQLACVGRLDPMSKGQDILLEALAQPQWRERAWTLNFYGGGRVRQGIERLAGELGVKDKVAFKGHQSVKDIWAQNHALALTSRYEGLPITIVEAMMCARPVVTTNVAGNAELLEEGVTGFIAETPTTASVAAALERFWERRGDLETIGLAAAKAVREKIPPQPGKDFAATLQGHLARSRAAL